MKLKLVPAGQGALWVRQGFRVFMKQPLAFTGLFFMYLAAMSILTIVPVIGALVPLVLVPAATLGFMAASHDASQGKFPAPTVLVSAFRAGRQRLRAMLVLGLLYALAVAGMFVLTGLFDGGVLASLALGGGRLTQETMEAPGFQLALMAGMAFYVPIALLFWHAPALVHWHGVSPVKSLFFSAVACIRNFGAFTVYGMAWGAVFFGSTLVVTLFAGVLLNEPNIAMVAMMPIALFLATVFFASFYFSFADCFDSEQGEHP